MFKALRDSLDNSYTVFHSVDLLTRNLRNQQSGVISQKKRVVHSFQSTDNGERGIPISRGMTGNNGTRTVLPASPLFALDKYYFKFTIWN